MRAAALIPLLGALLLAVNAPVVAATAEDLVARGDSLKASGKYAAAADAYRAALEEDPEMAAAHYGLGLLCLRSLEDYGCAAEHLRIHLRLRPQLTIVKKWILEAEEKRFRSEAEKNAFDAAAPLRAFSPSSLQEATIQTRPSDPEDKGDQAESEDRGDPEQVEIIAFRNLEGTVTDVGDDGVKIDLGKEEGVVKGMQFDVYRGGKWSGMLQITAVDEDTSTGRLTAGKKVGGAVAEGFAIEVGDEVRQREDVLGSGLANEAETREKILAWQLEQQGLQREMEALKEREEKILEALGTADSPRKKSRLLEDLTTLSGEFRDWRNRFTKWIDSVLKTQQESSADNPHFASYRRQLQERLRIENESALWGEVRTSSLQKIMKTLSNIPRFSSQEAADEFAERFYSMVYYFEQIQGDVERWQGQDEIFLTTRRFEDEEFAERILNTARYSLLTGKERRAARLFEVLLDKHPDGPFGNAAREGLERARLNLVLRGEAAEVKARFAPPLSLAWEQPCRDLQGAMHIRGSSILVFCGADGGGGDESAVRALNVETGEVAWGFTFPGKLGSNLVAAGGEALFVSDRGVLYQLDTGNGLPLREIPSGHDRNPVSRISRYGSYVTWIVSERLKKGRGNDLMYFIDLQGTMELRAAAVPGQVTATLLSGNRFLFAATGSEAPRRGDSPPGNAHSSEHLPQIPLPGSMPRPSRGKPPPMFVGAIGLQYPEYIAWGLQSGSIQWMGSTGDFLVLSILEQTDGEIPESHICFLGLGSKKESRWRISFSGRDAVADMQVDGDMAYIILRDGYLLAVNPDLREVVWKADLPVSSTDIFRWASFLKSHGDDLVVWCGSLDPPWRVYTVDRTDGMIDVETTVSNSLRTAPLLVDGHLFAAGQDGSLRIHSVIREKSRWKFVPERSASHFLPPPLPDPPSAQSGDFFLWDERQRLIHEEAFSSDHPGNRDSLVFDGDRIVYWSHRHERLYALTGEPAP